ncbi:hypothetical protein JCM8097_006532 [Rhodosporidiobolus ruineniae]
MSGSPAHPLVPDVFSSSSPSPLATTTSSTFNTHQRLSSDAPAWIPLSQPPTSQPRPLDTVEERSEDSRTRSSVDSGVQAINAAQPHPPITMPFSLPATPPQSPEPAQQPRLDSRFRSHRPTDLNLLGVHSDRVPFASLSAQTPTFNPVVGASPTHSSSTPRTSGSTTTPTRPVNPRLSHLRASSENYTGSRDFTSLPCTPLRSLERFSAALGSAGLAPPAYDFPASAGKSGWTWPPRSASFLDRNTAVVDGRFVDLEQVHQASPTRMVSGVGSVLGEDKERNLATRYVLVEGLERASTEEDLRNLLVERCKNLSLRGCFTSALRTHGIVVLVFNDVRHALAAVRLFSPGDVSMGLSSHEVLLDARCIARETLEELHPGPSPCPVLSRSEAVLVFTLRGPTTTPYFTPLPLLASFGAIRSLKVVEEHLHVVEYWDDRSAQTAFEVLDGREAGGVRFGCSFEPGVASTEATSLDPLTVPRDPFTAAYPTQPTAPLSHLAAPFSPQTQASYPSLATFTATPPTSPTYPFAPTHGSFGPLTQRDVNAAYYQDLQGARSYEEGAMEDRYEAVKQKMPWEAGYEQRSLNEIYIPGTGPYSSPASPVSPAFLISTASPSSYPSFPSASPHSASPRSATFPPSTGTGFTGGGGKSRHKSRLSEEFGIVRDDKIPTGNVLNFERIEQGLDMRTTLMLKNIPNKLKDWEVMAFIEEVVGRAFDFFYLRCDYSNDCNVGYGFVNFTSTTALLAFAKARLGTRWNMCGSDKLCIMSFANIQGKASLINHFKNSSVLDQEENRRPKLFVSSGPHAGESEAFPKEAVCDDPIRKARSAANAQNVGLFPSQKPVFKVAQAFKGLHI